MSKVIVYPQENTLALVFPTGEIVVEEVARKDVPAGVPYLIVDSADFPDQSFEYSDAWEADFTTPDGYGIGAEAWFAEQEAPRLAKEAEEKAAYEAEKATAAEKLAKYKAQQAQEGVSDVNN